MAVQVTTLFAPTVLTASAAVIYTAPASPSTTVLTNGRVRFTNTSAGARSITAYAVPAAGSPAAGNCFMNAEALAANAHVDVDVPLLGPGGTLQALADVTSDVTITALSGVLFS
jgi:hypothetical protein